jgi:hypothetical protein
MSVTLRSFNVPGEFEYLGPRYVWWQGVYSLMADAGVIISRATLAVRHTSLHPFQEAPPHIHSQINLPLSSA